MQACTIGGGERVPPPDAALLTASVSPPIPAEEEYVSDGPAILAALARDAAPGPAGQTWENAEEGTRGVITEVAEAGEEGSGCLAFTTTRESFDGVGLYRGSACRESGGALRLRDLMPL